MAVNRKKILELYDFGEGLGIRQISESLRNSRNTVRKTIRDAKGIGLSKAELLTMSEREVGSLLKGAADKTCYCVPDYEYISKELEADADVNLKLLWSEYCADCLKRNSTPYQYSRFCELYARWAKKAS